MCDSTIMKWFGMSNITETFGDTKISHEYVVDQVMNITECCNFLTVKSWDIKTQNIFLKFYLQHQLLMLEYYLEHIIDKSRTWLVIPKLVTYSH